MAKSRTEDLLAAIRVTDKLSKAHRIILIGHLSEGVTGQRVRGVKNKERPEEGKT